jgi:hypothetical protein
MIDIPLPLAAPSVDFILPARESSILVVFGRAVRGFVCFFSPLPLVWPHSPPFCLQLSSAVNRLWERVLRDKTAMQIQ